MARGSEGQIAARARVSHGEAWDATCLSPQSQRNIYGALPLVPALD